MMLQLKKQYGYQPYLSNQTYNILNQMFVSETIELPVLEETFCNIEDMPFKVWNYVKNINYTPIDSGFKIFFMVFLGIWY